MSSEIAYGANKVDLFSPGKKAVFFASGDFFEGNSTHAVFTRGRGNVGVLAFRGTDADDPTDLGDDADFRLIPWRGGGRMHRGFAHLGAQYYIDIDRRITCDPAAQFVASDQLRAREQDLIDHAWRRSTNALRDLSDHAPVNYVAPISAAPR
jgi:hypothetical protein